MNGRVNAKTGPEQLTNYHALSLPFKSKYLILFQLQLRVKLTKPNLEFVLLDSPWLDRICFHLSVSWLSGLTRNKNSKWNPPIQNPPRATWPRIGLRKMNHNGGPQVLCLFKPTVICKTRRRLEKSHHLELFLEAKSWANYARAV